MDIQKAELRVKQLEKRLVELELENAVLKKKTRFLDEQLTYTKNFCYRFDYKAQKFDYISNYAEEVSGFSPDELKQKSEIDSINEIHPADMDNVLKHANLFHNSEDKAITKTLVYRSRMKNGKYRWIRNSITSIKDEEGNLEAYLGSAIDITSEKEIEAKLKEEKQLSQEILDCNPNIIYVKDTSGKFTLINKAMANLFEEDRDTLIKRLNSDYDNFDYECDLLDKYENDVLRSGEPVTLNERFTSPGGKKYWLHTIKSRIELDDKKYLLVNSTDLTPLKESEIKLRNSETRYKSLIDSLNFPFIMLCNDLKILLINQTALKWFNTNQQEIINRPYTKFFGDKDSITKRIAGNISKTKSVEFESQICINQENKWVWLNIQPVKDFEGNNLGFQILIIDVTTRKRYEEELKKRELTFKGIINATKDLIFLIDQDFRIITANQSVAILSGYKIDDIIGKKAFYLYGDELGNKRTELAREVLRTKKVGRREEFHGGFYFDITMYPILDEKGKASQIVATVRDITPLKKAEIETRKALSKEIELSELKSSVLSTISHEFRTPLSIILSNIQQLKKYWNKLTQEDLSKKSFLIENSIKHMNYMLNNVSVLDKSDRDLLHYEPRATNIESLIYQLVQEAESLFNESNRISIQIKEKIGIIVVDETLIRHIIINLLTNALKYSFTKDKQVELSVAIKKNILEIKIQDYGIGINKNDLKSVWEPFFRGSNVSNIKGTGLGVTIVKRCVDLHKGSITINSKQNEGTIINLFLPINVSVKESEKDIDYRR